jgi:hypothetical protein
MIIQVLLNALRDRRRWFLALAATLATILIKLFLDEMIGRSISVTALAAFILWLIATAGWGKLLSKGIHRSDPLNYRLGIEITLGLLAQSIAYFLLTALGFSQFGSGGLFIFIAIGAFYSLPKAALTELDLNLPSKLNLALLPSFALICFIGLRIWHSLSPDMHPDALWYHLTAPLDWYSSGGFRFNPDAIQLMQSSYWESLYLWPFNLFGVNSTAALLASHIFAQLITITAWICTGLLGSLLLKEIMPGIPKNFAPCVILAILTTAELSLSLPTPKNDWGIALFFILGAIYLIKSNPSATGLLWGVSFGSKFSYLVPILIFLIIAASHLVGIKRKITPIIIFILAAAPVLVRNYLLTKNPLFPVFGGIFGNENLPDIWEGALVAFSGSGINLNPHHWQKILQGVFPGTQLLTVLLLLPAALKLYNSYWGRRFSLWALGSVAIFGLVSGDRAELRLIGVVAAIVSGASIYALYNLKDAPVFRIISKDIWGVMASLYLILGSETPWRETFRGPLSQPLKKLEDLLPLEFIESLPVNQNSKILLAYETRLFYLFDKGTVRIWDSLNAAPLWQGSIPDAISGSEATSFRYLLVSSTIIDNFLSTESVSGVVNYAQKHPTTIIFQDKDTLIIDLFLLKTHLMRKEGPIS